MLKLSKFHVLPKTEKGEPKTFLMNTKATSFSLHSRTLFYQIFPEISRLLSSHWSILITMITNATTMANNDNNLIFTIPQKGRCDYLHFRDRKDTNKLTCSNLYSQKVAEILSLIFTYVFKYQYYQQKYDYWKWQFNGIRPVNLRINVQKILLMEEFVIYLHSDAISKI